MQLKYIAGVAFLVGIVLHCMGVLVLDDGSASSSKPVNVVPGSTWTPIPVRQNPTATPLRDRASCNDIRGTTYRSDSERQWYLQNCS